MEQPKGDVTLLLDKVADGDTPSEEALLQRVYVELHRLALSRLRKERLGHTLQPTALVNEAWLRLRRADSVRYQDRVHFFRIAAAMMRRVVVDYARRRNAKKRVDGGVRVVLEEAIAISEEQSAEAVVLDELLNELARVKPRAAEVVELRFYAGLNEEEIAAALGCHVRTVRRDWLMARAWLHEKLTSRRTRNS
jgi:RNA polymerase sigma factor (TIGR02999 family)